MLIGKGLQKPGGGGGGPWNYFDNAYWVNSSNFTWSGSQWDENVFASGQAEIQETGTWASGFRPSSVDINYTFSGGSHQLRVIDSNAAVIGTANVSGTGTANITLTFTTYDISKIRLSMTSVNTGSITDIWFNS